MTPIQSALGYITPTVKLDERGFPEDPYQFGKNIQWAQDSHIRQYHERKHNVLFNKGRYFETSIYNLKILEEVSSLTDIAIQHNTMIVASWEKLEDFVVAMNCLNIYVEIEIDWI